MRRAIREHLRDFIAIVTLLVLGLAATVAILSQQQAVYPSWLPFLGDERFELKAEFTSAQAITPGQGQTVNVAGVEVGDVTEVELEQGTAVVTLSIEEEYADLIHEDTSMLLRPRTGLQDITLEVDAGSPDAPTVEEDSTIPVSQTQPNVQPDQILATLDGDTQAYLRLLLEGGAQGFGGSSRSPATWRGSTACSRNGGRTFAARSTTSGSSRRSWGATTPSSRSGWTRRTPP